MLIILANNEEHLHDIMPCFKTQFDKPFTNFKPIKHGK